MACFALVFVVQHIRADIFLSQVTDVEILTGKLQGRIALAEARSSLWDRRVPRSVESGRNCRIVGWFRIRNLVDILVAVGHKWAPDIAVAVEGHRRILDLLVQPSVVNFAGRIHRFGR